MQAKPALTTDEIDDRRWQAIARRDRRAPFLFGVSSTGIYCRPGCPARTPRRENVVPFDDAAAARTAGYRACKRCKPDTAGQP